jgi:alpha-L-rhamnosidase
MGQGGSWWRVSDGPIVECSVYDGEIYDARLERAGWDKPGWDAHDAARFGAGACSVEAPGGRLVPQTLEPIEVIETITPLTRSEPQPGVFVFDVGQNLSGWALLTVAGARGTAVTLRFAEVLRADGTVDQDNLRYALARDIYILKGEGVETWEPRFTYHGFRYIQVEGYPGVPALEAVQARVVRSAVASSGEFRCDDALINRLHRAVWWTEATNLHGLPTDCPQRDERMGWLNDMAARSEEAVYNFDVARLFSKWIADISDAQDAETGAVPDTAPYRWGSRPGDPVIVCYLLIPWLLYRHYGDTRTLSDHFDGMRRWVDYLTHRANTDHILEYSYYGDWAPPISEAVIGSPGASAVSRLTPGALVSTAHYFYSAWLLAKIAHVLGRDEAARQYAALAERIRAAFHPRFWDAATGGYGSNNQACNAIALYFGLVPEDCRAAVIENLARDVAARDNHLTTGNLATKYLLETLTANGYGDTALAIVTQTTYPSWGFMLENGATTIWERWETATNTGMNSRNHPMYASVGAWLYRWLAGIQVDAEACGFSRLVIRPFIPRSLQFAQAAVNTVRGRVESAWQRADGELSLKLSIPVGCEAAVTLPWLTPESPLKESGQVVTGANSIPGLVRVHAETGAVTLVIGSGDYHFTWSEDKS